MPKAPDDVRLERFIRPFLRHVTDDHATVIFRRGDEELQLTSVEYSTIDNRWTINFEEPYEWDNGERPTK